MGISRWFAPLSKRDDEGGTRLFRVLIFFFHFMDLLPSTVVREKKKRGEGVVGKRLCCLSINQWVINSFVEVIFAAKMRHPPLSCGPDVHVVEVDFFFATGGIYMTDQKIV